MSFDRRLTPARDDLAAAHLRGKIDAPRYADPVLHRVTAPVAPVHPRADLTTVQDTELLYGEGFDVFESSDGWAWGQSELDGYVGYVAERSLIPCTGASPTARIATLSATTYARPELKSPPSGRLPLNARVAVAEEAGGYARITDDLWVPCPQVQTLDVNAEDWVAVAEMFRGVPYVWGGRSSWGLDCSALVQLSRQAGGHMCPRDSDMQQAGLGETIDPNAPLMRGDLIFWRGHVGVMVDGVQLLHANAYHMAVAVEPLAEAVRRIAAAGDGEVTRRARLDADGASH